MDGDTIKVRVKERPFLVEATASNVEALIRFCRRNMEESKAKGQPQLKRKSGASAVEPPESPDSVVAAASCATPSAVKVFAMPMDVCPAIIGKVTWQPSKNAWAVHCKGADKKSIQSRVKVDLPTNAVDEKTEFEKARLRAYKKAVAHWNDVDQSKRDRIPMP